MGKHELFDEAHGLRLRRVDPRTEPLSARSVGLSAVEQARIEVVRNHTAPGGLGVGRVIMLLQVYQLPDRGLCR